MGTDADVVIEELHRGHDELAEFVRRLTPQQLAAPSAAAQWDVSQVLGHLGSGAVIALATLDAALTDRPVPDLEANRAIWAHWDAMTPQQRAGSAVAANGDLLARYDSLDAELRAELRINLGFLPDPVDLATAARFRLNEFALHSWDVRVAFDPEATLRLGATRLLLDHAALMLGWLSLPAALQGRRATLLVTLSDPDRRFGLRLAEAVTIESPPEQADGRVELPAEAWLRLISGRLSPQRTPAAAAVDGAVSLDVLRRVFPGY